MSEVARLRVTWNGAPVVGPGVSTFYATGTPITGWTAAVKALFQAVYQHLPTGLTWNIPNEFDILDVASGDLLRSASLAGGGSVASAGGAIDYKPGVGGRMRWGTTGVVAGRRVAGTTYLVPLTSQQFPNGLLVDAMRNAWIAAGQTYIATTGYAPVVYTRPRPARVLSGVPVPARAGATSPITSVSVPQAETWLRTRRT